MMTCSRQQDLIISLDNKGCKNASLKLQNSMSCLNGLTDGWALFLESIECVRDEYQNNLDKNEKLLLKNIHAAVYQAVYRRKFKPWWKIWFW